MWGTELEWGVLASPRHTWNSQPPQRARLAPNHEIRDNRTSPKGNPKCPIEFVWTAGSPSSPALLASSAPRPCGCWPTAFYNNAGIEGDIAPITQYSLESFRRVLDVNVVGVFLGMKHVLPVMLKQNKGSIVNTASIAGLIGSPDIAVYSASKHAVIGLTKSAAQECAKTGVRVNCVCPGLIDSRMLSAILDGRNPGNAPVPNERVVERIPARRLGLASEVASIVAFLASDEASYVSGSAYTVDGGRTAT